MGRRTGYGSFVTAMARAGRQMERAARQAERERLRNERIRQREQKETQRSEKELERLEKKLYLEEREEQVEELNSELKDRINALSSILELTLSVDDKILFSSLKQSKDYPKFQPPTFSENPPSEPTFLRKLLPGSKSSYEKSLAEWQERRNAFLQNVEELQSKYEKEKADFLEKVTQQHSEIDEFSKAYFALEKESIEAYCSMVLERSEYPDEFPQKFRVAYVSESKELVVEYKLPTIEVIPKEEEFRYVKSKDEISSKARKIKEIKDLYQDVVSAVAIRTIHEMFEADQANALQVVCFNGFVQTRDLATGNKIKPCLISARVTKDRFKELNLKHIDKKACLRNLGAQVSARPDELIPVKPVIEFDMVDKRFIEQGDLLSALESRPNLMELSPSEFENLVSNLFQKLGLESKLTRSSKDGGVDCVAFDSRPVLGGKVVIQAKRYRHTVGVSAVRDLFGTMQHEGANKGILVTTSGYGPDAFEFSKDKPIELIGGSQLLYLLEQVGIEARIILPEEN